MASLAVAYEARRFDGGSYPSMPSMHNHDADQFPGAPDDIDMSPFDGSPGMLGDDVMGADLDSDVQFDPHHHDSSVVEIHDALADSVSVPGGELDDPADTISAAAAAAMAAASIAVGVPPAESSGTTSDPISDLVSGPSSSRGAQDRTKVKKPERVVTRAPDGLYHCTLQSCDDEQRSFCRKCEFNKHMDKHERPYRCAEVGCEKLVGFTYSGGLMRHEREVHGMHGGPKNKVKCPFSNCKRYNGKGFSRQENLNEHIRRLHGVGGVVPEAVHSSSSSGTPSPQKQPQQHHEQQPSSPQEEQQRQQKSQQQSQQQREQHGQCEQHEHPEHPEQREQHEQNDQREQHDQSKERGQQRAQRQRLQTEQQQARKSSSPGNRPSSKRSRSPSDDGGNNEKRTRRLDLENWELREMVLALEREKMAMRKTIDELMQKLEARPSSVAPEPQKAVQAPTPAQAQTETGGDSQQRHGHHGGLDVASDGHMA